MSDRVVARLRYPLGVSGLARVVKGLEACYGKGLVILTGGDDWVDGWLTIAQPDPMAAAIERVKGAAPAVLQG